ncbi:hypothetical protein [Trebonia sp.]|uniref:hypothetical protein n=1 Tax=Trebonia sp. TaxID=2767075 RepID=UPI002601D622|nr:hypothetical protein [Trebonia sp.]
MIVFLWDAGNAHGVTDDESRARQAAGACLISGQATTARVERAVTVLGICTLTTCYQRTGDGWSARRRDGRITRWQKFDPAAS